MSDDSDRSVGCDSLDSYNVITDKDIYNGIKDRRDRFAYSWCADEPSLPLLLDYQRILDKAYEYKNNGRLDRAYAILTKAASKRLPVSYYQIARTEYLLGEYFRERDAHPLVRRRRKSSSLSTAADNQTEQPPPLAQAADHFCRGAAAARRIPDWALYAQLKFMESNACIGVDPKQLRRAFGAAAEALSAWRRLPVRYLAADDHFEFRLADSVGVRGELVGEDDIATGALERAAVLLQRLGNYPDASVERYANDAIWLDWDWAVLDLTKGNPRVAFRRALRTRRKGHDLFSPCDRVRLARFIAFVAMDCVEAGGLDDYSGKRLLNVADAEIQEAYGFLRDCADKPVRAMVLLAEARLLGMQRVDDGRADKIVEAGRIAEKLRDVALQGQVDLAWGDEYRFQGKKKRARECYQKALDDMTKADFIELARIAQLRLKRLK